MDILKIIDTSNLVRGRYSLSIDLEYEGQTEPATTQAVFYVGIKVSPPE